MAVRADMSIVLGFWQADLIRDTVVFAGDITRFVNVPSFEPVEFRDLKPILGIGTDIDLAEWLAESACPVINITKTSNAPGYSGSAFLVAQGPKSSRSHEVEGKVVGQCVDASADSASYLNLVPQILETLPDPVFVYEVGRGWVFVNRMAVELLSSEPAIDEGVYDLAMPKGFRRMMIHMLDRACGARRASRIEFYAKHRTLGPRWWSGLWAPLFSSDGELSGVFVLHRDVSEQTQMQGQLLRERKKLHRMATTDPLTRLNNRRSFLSACDAIIAAEAKLGRTLSVILFDIDHFKSVNDTHGHAAGDMVLKAVADAARREMRPHDMLARWGGEEFIVCLPDTDLDQACQIGERLRRSIERLSIECQDTNLKTSASFGAATSNAQELLCDGALDGFIALADQALYEAKGRGRNRLVHSEELACTTG